MRLFPATQPLESISVYLLGPLPKSKTGNRFTLVMAYRFTKLTQVVHLKPTTRRDIAKAFASHWVFKYATLKEVLSGKGSQFASKLYHNTCSVLGIANTFTTAYRPKTNGQVERFNRSI